MLVLLVVLVVLVLLVPIVAVACVLRVAAVVFPATLSSLLLFHVIMFHGLTQLRSLPFLRLLSILLVFFFHAILSFLYSFSLVVFFVAVLTIDDDCVLQKLFVATFFVLCVVVFLLVLNLRLPVFVF